MIQLRRQHRWYPEHRTVGILGRRDQKSRPARQRWAHTCERPLQKSGCVVNVFYFFPTTRPRTKRNKPPSMSANHPTGVVSLPVATKTLHARLHTCRRAVVGGEIGKKNATPSAPPPPTHAALPSPPSVYDEIEMDCRWPPCLGCLFSTKTLHARLHTCRRAVVGGEIGKKNAPPSAPPPPTHAALRLLRRCTMKLKWIVVARPV